MNYEWFVSLRYLRAKRKQTFISVISFLSIAGVMLGVAALIVVLAVMTGFHDAVRQQILGSIPHVLIQRYGDELKDVPQVIAEAKAVSTRIVSAQPFVSKEAMLVSRGNVAAVTVKGVDRTAVKAWAREERLDPYDQETQTGYLRHLVVREGRNTGQVLVQLVTAPGERFDSGYFVDVLRRFPEVRSVHWAVNDTPAEVTNLPTRLLWGEEAIEEELCGLRFRVRPGAFLQTNTEMAERLYALAREYAALTGSETVYDLYCGTGTIALTLARDALTVWGVEVSEESVACAIENAELNGIGNAAFFAGNVGQSIEELQARAGQPDVVVVDPPRAGLAGKALRRTGALQASRLVYVSCNPTTLASDLRTLRDDFGYELRRTRPVDMFPHTPHVESVSLLELS